MEFYDVLRARRSIRAFDGSREVPEAALERIMKAVQCAPSACNRQPWRFEIVFNRELREKIGNCYPKTWLLAAPAIIVVLGDYSSCWKRLEGTPSVEIDIGIAMEHLVLAAAAEGLSTCWVCAFEKARLNQVMNVKAPWSVEAISPLGYGTGAPQGLPYKPVDEIFKVRR